MTINLQNKVNVTHITMIGRDKIIKTVNGCWFIEFSVSVSVFGLGGREKNK